MLVGNSLPEYIFTRLAIFGLRIIAPLSISYTFYTILGVAESSLDDSVAQFSFYRLPLPLEIYLFIEAAFFFLVYLPLGAWLQSAATHPEPPGPAERRALFQRCLDTLSDPEHYLQGWFLGASLKAIKRDNVAEYVAWSLMNAHFDELDAAQLQEVNGFVEDLERKLGWEFSAGRGSASSLRGTFDHVPMQHRPLVWYMIVCVVDGFTHARLLSNSLRFYRASLASTMLIFPPRPLAIFGRRQHAPGKLAYWYHNHTSKSKLPMVFIHGIGVGLYAYVDFISLLISQQGDDDDGEVGIIVIELLPISSRICPPALSTEEMKTQLKCILETHGWEDFILIGHSYGTAIAATVLRDVAFSERIRATMLMDPICFLLHLPDVDYNFTRRKPQRANERMLNYFSSQDMLISHTLARRFFWSEYILWKDDIDTDMPLAVTLSGQDLIVPTNEVWTYLTGSAAPNNVNEPQGERVLRDTVQWQQGNQEVLWFEKFDHAGVFSSKGARRGVAEVVKKFCYEGSRGND